MFIVLVYKDGDAYEYRYDTLEEAQAHNARENESELICPMRECVC